MTLLSIDRFEGDWAICETEAGTMLRLPREKLPAQAKEGDFLRECGSGYQLDAEARAAAEQRNAEALRRLFSNSQNK